VGNQANRLQKRKKKRGAPKNDSGVESGLTGLERTDEAHEEIRRRADMIFRERVDAARDLQLGKKGAARLVADWLQAERSVREGRKRRNAQVESDAAGGSAVSQEIDPRFPLIDQPSKTKGSKRGLRRRKRGL
jgi:hypothetical protein